jgi:hypothetical protein
MDRPLSACLIVAVCLPGLLFASGLAFADEWDVPAYFPDQYDVPPSRVVRPAPPPPMAYPPADGPAVFGWVAERPASCGEFRYWDGTQCLDARDDPPYVGPRW